jgi:predicted RNA-binding protein with PIN domain
MEPEALIVVDGANVVGSVPDGWWRDRRGAATRLRDALAARDTTTLPAALLGAVTLVVEGAARGVPPVAGVAVEAAPKSGDDHIVALVADNVGRRPVVVVTSDRELRQRVRELGASIVSPGELRASIPYGGRREST